MYERRQSAVSPLITHYSTIKHDEEAGNAPSKTVTSREREGAECSPSVAKPRGRRWRQHRRCGADDSCEREGAERSPSNSRLEKNNTNESARRALTDGGSGGGEQHVDENFLEVETDGSGSIERLITVGDCEEASRGRYSAG